MEKIILSGFSLCLPGTKFFTNISNKSDLMHTFRDNIKKSVTIIWQASAVQVTGPQTHNNGLKHTIKDSISNLTEL